MIFDEPFNGVESITIEKIKNELIKQKKMGKIIIISSHIKEDLEEIADEIYCFDSGEVSKI